MSIFSSPKFLQSDLSLRFFLSAKQVYLKIFHFGKSQLPKICKILDNLNFENIPLAFQIRNDFHKNFYLRDNQITKNSFSRI